MPVAIDEIGANRTDAWLAGEVLATRNVQGSALTHIYTHAYTHARTHTPSQIVSVIFRLYLRVMDVDHARKLVVTIHAYSFASAACRACANGSSPSKAAP